jgi:hypothetical protein
MTRSIKAFEKAKSAMTRKNVEKNEFNQICREQKFLCIVHHDQAKN